MKTLNALCLLTSGAILTSIPNAMAETSGHNHGKNHTHNHSAVPSAPADIMGEHTHEKGKFMLSYRYKRMDMNGNLQGDNSISPEEIVTTITNPNAPPATLRVVPTKMTMDMHMLGAMYGISDKITVMGMAMYMDKEMDHTTFSGMSGTNILGSFTTNSSGWGDTSLHGIYKLYNDKNHTINISLGISAPTGSIKKEDTVLTPLNTTPILRLPYSMQLGSGTWDALPSITYSGYNNKLGWGAQYSAIIRLEDKNSQGYRWGNSHKLSLWGGYQINDILSINSKLSGRTMGKIKGSDALVTAPVQTADPQNYGGKIIDFGAGFNIRPKLKGFEGLELGINFDTPIYQNLNGIQMENNWNISTAITYRF